MELQSPSLSPISNNDIISSQITDIVCSSDQGELEEEAARMLGEDYWLEAYNPIEVEDVRRDSFVGGEEHDEKEIEEEDIINFDSKPDEQPSAAVSFSPLFQVYRATVNASQFRYPHLPG